MTFASHLDGHRIFMGPEESMRIQSNLGSDIAMAFDECVENPATYEYAKNSCERTLRWLERCKIEHDRLNALSDTVNPQQMLFGINQGATFADLRVWHMKEIAKIDCDGYAIGGLAVGEPTQVMYDIIDAVEPFMPKDKPRYLMGVGTPSNIVEGGRARRGLFRLRDAGTQCTPRQALHLERRDQFENEKYKLDERPIDEQCDCPTCRNFSRAYLRHLFKAEEMLALRLAVMHNLYFYNKTRGTHPRRAGCWRVCGLPRGIQRKAFGKSVICRRKLLHIRTDSAIMTAMLLWRNLKKRKELKQLWNPSSHGRDDRGLLFPHHSSGKQAQKAGRADAQQPEKGDRVTTIGGMVGKIVQVNDSTIVFETSEDRVRIEVTKWAVQSTGAMEQAAAQKSGKKADKVEEEKAGGDSCCRGESD